METKNSFKRSSFIVSVLGLAIFSMIIMSLGFAPAGHGSYIKPAPLTGSTPKQVSLPSRQTGTVTYPTISGLPVRLTISKINVNASVISVGITPTGAMDVPKGAYDVAWFKFGPRPGQKGSAVIDGHFGVWKNGAVSVFHNLYKLNKGDIVSVKDDKGAIVSFVVRESKIYDPSANPTEVFTSSDGKAHLNLITCVYDKATRTYPKRLVVFTDKVI